MMKEPRTPGEARIDPNTGLPPALNNTAEDPNDVARSRERVIQATAVAATGGEGEIAPPPALDSGPAMRTAKLGGEDVKVRLSPVRRDAHSVKYGPESKLPKGTPVNKDGSVCEGTAQPYGIIGDIETPQGWLINRIIPMDALDTDETKVA